MSIFKSIAILALIGMSACMDNMNQSTLTCSEQSERSCVSFNTQCLATIQNACFAADKVCSNTCSGSSCDSCHRVAEKACAESKEVCAVYDKFCPATLTSICEGGE